MSVSGGGCSSSSSTSTWMGGGAPRASRAWYLRGHAVNSPSATPENTPAGGELRRERLGVAVLTAYRSGTTPISYTVPYRSEATQNPIPLYLMPTIRGYLRVAVLTALRLCPADDGGGAVALTPPVARCRSSDSPGGGGAGSKRYEGGGAGSAPPSAVVETVARRQPTQFKKATVTHRSF